MARKVRQIRSIEPMLTDPELEDIIMEFAEQVYEAATVDPNQDYVDSLEVRPFFSDRVIGQVGAGPGIGTAVEAKRGTLARALATLTGGSMPVQYTTRDGRTRFATQAQVDNWSRRRRT